MNIQKIPNQIIKNPLTPLNLKKVDTIALHHMASEGSVKDMERAHINQGWSAIGYNYWVAYDGTVYCGRGLNLGAGVAGHNSHVISIGFQGDYHSKPKTMPDAQYNAGIDIIRYVKEKVPTIRKVCGHKDLMSTACPGIYFPLAEMKTLKKRAGELTVTQYEELKKELEELKASQEKVYHYTIELPDWAKPTVQKLLYKGLYKGADASDLNMPESLMRILVINDRAGLYD